MEIGSSSPWGLAQVVKCWGGFVRGYRFKSQWENLCIKKKKKKRRKQALLAQMVPCSTQNPSSIQQIRSNLIQVDSTQRMGERPKRV